MQVEIVSSVSGIIFKISALILLSKLVNFAIFDDFGYFCSLVHQTRLQKYPNNVRVPKSKQRV
jgi:hypothetical protein